MHDRPSRGVIALFVFLIGAASAPAAAQTPGEDGLVLGFKLRFGGRYDDVRMCVASDAGVKGGIAADISLFVDVGLSDAWALHVDLPVFRPILFAVAHDMLQFEPSVALTRRIDAGDAVDVLVGPMLGLSLHYGPDYRSTASGDGRGPSFFAVGPTVGGYVGVDFLRGDRPFNFQLGVTPYVTPLFSTGDAPIDHGVVVGGLVDALFRWGVQ